MPRDPQGAGTRTETKVWFDVVGDGWATCGFPDEDSAKQYQQTVRPSRIERIETTTTITREEL